MSVVDAVKVEIELYGERAAESALAASALSLAAEMDDVIAEQACEKCGAEQSWAHHNSATSKAMVAKELRETLAVLRALAPPKSEEDDIDRARRRRDERLAGRSAARSSSSP